jgi:phenylpropionate dioxygenase-like ring-hydroxylating dioxygenase large terminal subunit
MNTVVRTVDRGSPSQAAAGGAEWPPGWDVQPYGISVGRYIDPAFDRLEHERLWSRVWQAAARLDEIPEAGDYTVYEIGDQAIVLVRVDAATVKAYHNVCPHRGTALAQGAGHFASNRIMCPFHGWRWNFAGQNQFVLERQEFCQGQLRDSDVALRNVAVELFAGFVFINLDPNPPSFDEFIAPVREVVESLAIGDMHHYW